MGIARVTQGFLLGSKRRALEQALLTAGHKWRHDPRFCEPWSAAECVENYWAYLDGLDDPTGTIPNLEEVEFHAIWPGEKGVFLRALLELHWIDKVGGRYVWHDYFAVNGSTIQARLRARKHRDGGRDDDRDDGRDASRDGPRDGGRDEGLSAATLPPPHSPSPSAVGSRISDTGSRRGSGSDARARARSVPRTALPEPPQDSLSSPGRAEEEAAQEVAIALLERTRWEGPSAKIAEVSRELVTLCVTHSVPVTNAVTVIRSATLQGLAPWDAKRVVLGLLLVPTKPAEAPWPQPHRDPEEVARARAESDRQERAYREWKAKPENERKSLLDFYRERTGVAAHGRNAASPAAVENEAPAGATP